MANQTPGKIQELYDANSRKIYSRPSPFTENTGVLAFGPRQPFVYTKIDDGKRGLNKMKRFDSQAFPFVSSLYDTKRIVKFMVTGNGLLFITKQFFLQKNQAFNETRIYNPLSPILAVSTRINPFSDKNPSRFIDTSGGTMGILKSMVGLPSKTVPAPPGTVGLGALSEKNKSSSKGLLRAHTAINGYSRLEGSSPKPTSFLSSLKSLFSFKPQKQPTNASFRADEGGYGIQLKPGGGKYDYFDKDGSPVKWGEDYYMRFEAGKNNGNSKTTIRKNSESSTTTSKRKNNLLRVFGRTLPRSSTYYGVDIGYDEKEVNGYIRYGQNVGRDRILSEGGSPTYKFSDIISIYKLYTSPTKEIKSESKFNDRTNQSFKTVEDNLKKLIRGIESAGYKFSPLNNDDKLVKQFSHSTLSGMDEITGFTKSPNSSTSPANYDSSYEKDVIRNPKLLDGKRKGFSGAYRSDKINRLTILEKNGTEFKTSDDRSNIKSRDGLVFKTTKVRTDNGDLDFNDDVSEYSPYTDDQIAFYFHDLVNDKYIPFRATIKGLNEQLTSNWSDITYIGRADKLFNYTGFSRTTAFSFTVAAMSLSELLPMWVRINYLATLVKPSRYTSPKTGEDYIVPPMTTITIGDLYKEQPFVLKTVTITIPEDALWETVSENNDAKDWSYLNEKLVYEGSMKKGLFAQFPRECEISIGGELLERIQPKVGRPNFGGIDKLGTSGKFSDRLTTVVF